MSSSSSRRGPAPFWVKAGIVTSVVVGASAALYVAFGNRKSKQHNDNDGEHVDRDPKDHDTDGTDNDEDETSLPDVYLDTDRGSRCVPVTLPAYVQGHPRFGAPLNAIIDLHVFKRGHCVALVRHIADMLVAYASLYRDTEDDRCVQSVAQLSRSRSKVMRRIVRMARSCHIPLVSNTNRLIDADIQKHFDEVKVGTDEIMHNAHLLLGEKMAAHADMHV